MNGTSPAISSEAISLELKQTMVHGQIIFYVEDVDSILYKILLPPAEYESARLEIREKITKEDYDEDRRVYVNALVPFVQERMRVSAAMALDIVKNLLPEDLMLCLPTGSMGPSGTITL